MIMVSYRFIRLWFSKLAVALSVVTVVAGISTAIPNFKEDYCWRKGTAADSTGSAMIIASEEDLQWDSTLKPGESQVGKAWQAHMRCHQTFEWGSAIVASLKFWQ